MSRPVSPEQYEPSWNAAAQADAEARRESGPPDEDRTAAGLLSILDGTVAPPRQPRHDGGPSVGEYLRSRGER